MQNFQDTFEIRNQSFNSAFSISMTVPLIIEFFKKNWKELQNFKYKSARTDPLLLS